MQPLPPHACLPLFVLLLAPGTACRSLPGTGRAAPANGIAATSSPAVPPAAYAADEADDGPLAPADGNAAPPSLALGIVDLALPACAAAAPEPEASFCTSAHRAVRRTFEDDDEDPAVPLALQHALVTDPRLAHLRAAWRRPLEAAVARCAALTHIGPALRLLRRALADAYLDRARLPQGAGTAPSQAPDALAVTGVQNAACQQAFALLPAAPGWLEMVVTVEPLGTYPLSRFRSCCFGPAAPAP